VSAELFNPEVVTQDSPRLAWMKKHDVKTVFHSGVVIGDEDEFGNELFPWTASTSHGIDPKRAGDAVWCRGAETEHGAIVELAIWQGWKLWNEE
jgi:hypothetical protein